MTYTNADCTLEGRRLLLSELSELTSDNIAAIVGFQCPSGDLNEDASHYTWTLIEVPLVKLLACNEDGEEPEGGWKAAYLRHKQSDEEAVASGSPEYAGRQEWLDQWCKNTSQYPIFLVVEDGDYRLWDGYHRLAGAFWNEIPSVTAFVGTPKPTLDITPAKRPGR